MSQPHPLPPPGVDLVHIVARPMLAQSLIGMEVREASGAAAGTVIDLVFEPARNRAQALVVLHDGVFQVSLFDLRLSLTRAHLRLRPGRAGIAPATAALEDAPRARRWLGQPIHMQGGERLGRLAAALVDVHEGAVAFVLVEREERLHPLPLDALVERAGRLELAIDPARLEPRYSFSRGKLRANLAHDAFLTRHAEYADRLTTVNPTP